MTRLLPGPDGEDSPILPGRGEPPLQAWVWEVWTRIAADRAAGRPTDLHYLAAALELDSAPPWHLWWDRPHRGPEPLTHRASLVGRTLVTACGYSTPVRPRLLAWEIGGRAIKDSWRTYCRTCEELAPAILPNPRRPAA